MLLGTDSAMQMWHTHLLKVLEHHAPIPGRSPLRVAQQTLPDADDSLPTHDRKANRVKQT